jgi:hypothetical protein
MAAISATATTSVTTTTSIPPPPPPPWIPEDDLLLKNAIEVNSIPLFSQSHSTILIFSKLRFHFPISQIHTKP